MSLSRSLCVRLPGPSGLAEGGMVLHRLCWPPTSNNRVDRPRAAVNSCCGAPTSKRNLGWVAMGTGPVTSELIAGWGPHFSGGWFGAKQKEPVPHPIRILPWPPRPLPVPALNSCFAIELLPVWHKIPNSVVWNFTSSYFWLSFLFCLVFKN